MGDIIEFTTWQKHKNTFYKVNSSAINFDVKGRGPAKIGLSIGHNTRAYMDWFIITADAVSMKSHDRQHGQISGPNILRRDEYTRFWISWTSNLVALGKCEDKEPMLQYKTKLLEINYVTFCVDNNQPPASWRFELHPILKEPSFKSISKGKLEWVPGDTQLPNNAVIGGFCKENIYVIRAKHRGSLTPGGFVPSQGVGYIPWGGESNEKTTFEVLCGFDYMWVPSKKDIIPVGAFEAGYSEVNHEPLYIGRAMFEGNLIPGKVQPSHKVCYIYGGRREIAMENYEILIVPYKYMEKKNLALGPAHNRQIGDLIENTSDDSEEEMDHYAYAGDDYYEEHDEDEFMNDFELQ